jgi:hypothetical protein
MPDEDREKNWWLKSKYTLSNTRPKESKAAKISDIEQVEIVVDDHTPNEVSDDDMRRSKSRSQAIHHWHLRLFHRSKY